MEVVHVEAAAWNLWQSRPDKEWNLVDCASYVVMQQRGLSEALTIDHHVEQAGFVRLLKYNLDSLMVSGSIEQGCRFIH